MTPPPIAGEPIAGEPIAGDPIAGDPAADEPVDDLDLAILDGIADLFGRADPVPSGLVQRIRFAVALEDIEAEVSRLREQSDLDAAAVRGEEQSRTITFDSTSLTIMITISVVTDGTVRLDGWLAPPAAHRVELRISTGRLQTDADEQGRFVLDAVPRGLAQLVVRTGGDPESGSARSVATPSIVM